MNVSDEALKFARVGYKWGNCKTVEAKQLLFKKYPQYRGIYLNIERIERHLIALLLGFEIEYSGIAFSLLSTDQKATVLSSIALSDGSKGCLPFIELMEPEETAKVLLNVAVPGPIRVILKILPKNCKKSILAEMTKQLEITTRAITIFQCLKHSYHLSCKASHTSQCAVPCGDVDGET